METGKGETGVEERNEIKIKKGKGRKEGDLMGALIACLLEPNPILPPLLSAAMPKSVAYTVSSGRPWLGGGGLRGEWGFSLHLCKLCSWSPLTFAAL